jgi:hypothetical protein
MSGDDLFSDDDAELVEAAAELLGPAGEEGLAWALGQAGATASETLPGWVVLAVITV